MMLLLIKIDGADSFLRQGKTYIACFFALGILGFSIDAYEKHKNKTLLPDQEITGGMVSGYIAVGFFLVGIVVLFY